MLQAIILYISRRPLRFSFTANKRDILWSSLFILVNVSADPLSQKNEICTAVLSVAAAKVIA
jgi:hypothetical protein